MILRKKKGTHITWPRKWLQAKMTLDWE